MQKKDRDERLDTDEDLINAKRFDNSLSNFLEKHPGGTDFRTISGLLQLASTDVEEIYQAACRKFKRLIGYKDE